MPTDGEKSEPTDVGISSLPDPQNKRELGHSRTVWASPDSQVKGLPVGITPCSGHTECLVASCSPVSKCPTALSGSALETPALRSASFSNFSARGLLGMSPSAWQPYLSVSSPRFQKSLTAPGRQKGADSCPRWGGALPGRGPSVSPSGGFHSIIRCRNNFSG